MLSLGIANFVCGLLGGTPCAGGLLRTSVNVTFGATHKLSQFISGVLVLLIAILFLPGFTYIPISCFAAILMNCAIKLIPFQAMGILWGLDKVELLILLATCTTCIWVDAVIGLLAGAGVCLLRDSALAANCHLETIEEDEGVTIQIKSTRLNYVMASDAELSIQQLIGENLDDKSYILLDLRDIDMIDFDGLEVLNLLYRSRKQIRMGAVEPIVDVPFFSKSALYKELEEQRLLFATVEEGQKALMSRDPTGSSP